MLGEFEFEFFTVRRQIEKHRHSNENRQDSVAKV